ncbi:MAG: hypothetical protein KBD27_02315 [Candidatus Moranbacteria bacterium]|nr:hypothetical protein [Candidatus Moranbacteria bacterium]
MNEYQKLRVWLRRAVKVHAMALFVVLGVYFVFAFLDPGLLSYDMRQKFRALALDTITVTATVLDAPMVPVVTGVALCDESNGTLQIDLDWSDDVNTVSYDIDRDSTPLVSGLSSSAYSDTLLAVATTYEYVVTAYGPMDPGLAASLPLSVTTPSTCEITAPAPAVTIVSFAGRNIDSYNGTPRVNNRRPIFSGTTSMANAVITVTLGQNFIAEFSANSNGYWEWKPPYGVPSGAQTFTVTATDPSDASREATASLRFDILRDDRSGSSKNDAPTAIDVETDTPATIPLSFTLSVDQSVLQGEKVQTKIVIDRVVEKYSHITIPIRYSVVDQDGAVILTEMRSAYIEQGTTIIEAFSIPLYVLPGVYTVQTEVLLNTLSIGRSASFSVQALPLIQLSSGATWSYADIVRQLGWVVLFSLMLFFLWLALFIREFGLYLQGDGEVTEYDLKKAGYFRR